MKEKYVDMIGIDLDSPSVYSFLREYCKAKAQFPHAEIKAWISNSGRGFHIEIKTKVTIMENFLWRAYFNDCTHRLRYSMQKYIIDPDEQWHDLLFEQKGKGRRQELDMDTILKPYKKKIKLILKELGSERSMMRLQKMSEELKILPDKYWVVACEVKGRIEKEELQKFGDKMNIEKGYRYKVTPNFYPGQGQFLFFWKINDLKEARKFMEILPLHANKSWLKEIKTE